MTLGGDGYLKTVLNANSGLIMDGKGSITMMLARRQADKYSVLKVFFRAYSYYLNANYAPSEDQRFEFIMLGSPQRHGVNYFYQRKRHSIPMEDTTTRFIMMLFQIGAR